MKKSISIMFVFAMGIACQVNPVLNEASEHGAKTSWDRWAESNPAWVKPVAPHRIIDNIYYVGSEGLGSYLIATDAGHVLLDGGLPQNAVMIVESISELGYDIRDVNILINSHAHFDHSGGLAKLKAASGAKFLAMQGDKSSLEDGSYLGSEDNQDYVAPKVMVDQVIEDGEAVTIGNTVLTANLTPGHSRGCTTWTMTAQEGGREYDVLFFCSASVAGNRLEPPQYAGVVEDYRKTFAKTRRWRPDVPLSNHPNFYFKQLEKMKGLGKEGVTHNGLAFVDRQSFPLAMYELEKKFVKSLAEQRDYDSRVESYRFGSSRLTNDAHYLFYLHGRIVEDQGMSAVSSEYGEYQYIDILERWEKEGFVVFSESRKANTDAQTYARNVAMNVETLLAKGVSADHITVVGASKGAYIAALVSHYVKNPGLKTVLMALCSEGTVRHMLEKRIDLHGRLLAVGEASDTLVPGSCQSVFDASEGATGSREIVLKTGLSHGLIYRPLEDWVVPVVDWAKKN